MSSPADSLRFLVVDDTDDIRDLMSRMIARLGHHVTQAADGFEAVAALQQSAYDILLLDLSMPRMSGEDVVRWLNDNPHHLEGLRVVVITAWAGERRAVLQELGVAHVLHKPLRTRQLHELLEEVAADPHS